MRRSWAGRLWSSLHGHEAGNGGYAPSGRPRSRPVLSYSETGRIAGRSVEIVGCADAHGCQLRRRLASSYAVGAMPGGLAALAARKCGTGEVATAAGWRRLRRVLEAR